MGTFQSAYSIYVFSLIENRTNDQQLKLGFASTNNHRNTQDRLTEWGRDYRLTEDYTFKNICEIPCCRQINSTQVMCIGKHTTHHQHRDEDIRNLLYECGITREVKRNIYIKNSQGVDTFFTIEGIRPRDPNISIEEFIEQIRKVIEETFEGKHLEYCDILTNEQYEKFKKEIEKSQRDFVNSQTNKFYDHLKNIYGELIPLNFIESLACVLVYDKELFYELQNDLSNSYTKLYNKLINSDLSYKTKCEYYDIHNTILNYRPLHWDLIRWITKKPYDGEQDTLQLGNYDLNSINIGYNTFFSNKIATDTYTGLPTLYIPDDVCLSMLNHNNEQELINSSIKYIIIDRPELYEKVKKYNKTIICIAYTEQLMLLFEELRVNQKFVIFIDDISYTDNPQKCLSVISNKINEIDMDILKNSVIVANPPYNGNGNMQQIYPLFYEWAIQSGAKKVCMIFPSNWQDPKSANGLDFMNKKDTKEDKQIVFIDNYNNESIFKNGAGKINIICWEKNYDNGLNGKQKIYTNGENPREIKLNIDKESSILPEVKEMVEIVEKHPKFKSFSTIYSNNKSYGLRTDVFAKYEKYGLPEFSDNKVNETDLRVYGKYGKVKYISKDYPLPKDGMMNPNKYKYRSQVPECWGSMSDQYGGQYGHIKLARPGEICTETYNEGYGYDDLKHGQYSTKYILTKFVRTLLLNNKTTRHTPKSTWASVPIQDFSEDFWESDDINYIDDCLFEKYNIPEHLRQFIKDNIQELDINWIDYYYKSYEETHSPTISTPVNKTTVQPVSKPETPLF